MSSALLALALAAVPAPAQTRPAPPAHVPAAPALAALAARGWAEAGSWTLVKREGVSEHGHRVLTLDAVATAAPAAGSSGHLDLKLQAPGLPAVLDNPLDRFVAPSAAPGVTDADLARGRLRYGLATAPEERRRGLGALLLELADALAAEHGSSSLVIYATPSSRPFYRRRFAGRVRADEELEGPDEWTYHRLVVELPPAPFAKIGP